MRENLQYTIRIISSLGEISPTDWDRLIPGNHSTGTRSNQNRDDRKRVNPFITHGFLSALEDSGSATIDSGWLAQHLLLLDDKNAAIAALPCYLKSHSQGEYVFDQGWADAFERAGGRYYPKLQCSVPFTPVAGPRFLIGNSGNAEQYRLVLANGLKQLGNQHQASSAHITFLPHEDWQAMDEHGFLLRIDQQFHWQNNSYEDFDQFLAALASRKRKNIRKERKAAHDIEGVEIVWIEGADITENIWDEFFKFYLDTGSRKWGRPYLTREFFSLIGERMPEQIVLIMAQRAGKYIAGAINFVGDNCLFGRHWGCIEFHPALHFEICYYQAIEYAIAHGLARVEAGAQGEHKLARGYIPVTTYSAHWIENPGLRQAVANYLQDERAHVKMANEYLSAQGPFHRSGNN